MRTRSFSRLLMTAALSALVLSACGKDKGPTDPDDLPPDDPNNPNNPAALGLAVGVRVDTLTFQSNGEFVLELIPTTAQGQSLVAEPWTIAGSVDAPATVAVSLLQQGLDTPDNRPFSIAIDLDDSESMIRNDPDLERAAAAKLFWEGIFSRNAASQVSLFDFGNFETTPGFTRSRMLHGWTSDAASLEAQLGQIHAEPSGVGSAMYRSAAEVLRWVDTTSDGNATRRTLVLLTDGQANDVAQLDALVQQARALNTRIFAVGISEASDRGDDTDDAAVASLQLLASSTGGLYAGAATPERLTSVLQSFATNISGGGLLARFKLNPVPAKGTVISGKVRLTNQTYGIASGTWTFIAP